MPDGSHYLGAEQVRRVPWHWSMGGVCEAAMDMQDWNCRALCHEQRLVAHAREGNCAKSATETKAGVIRCFVFKSNRLFDERH